MKLFSRSGGGPGAPWRAFFAALTPRCTPSESAEAPGTSPSHPLEPRFSLVFQSFPGSWKPEPAPDVPTSSPNLSKTMFSLLGPLKIDFHFSRLMKISIFSPGVTSEPSTSHPFQFSPEPKAQSPKSTISQSLDQSAKPRDTLAQYLLSLKFCIFNPSIHTSKPIHEFSCHRSSCHWLPYHRLVHKIQR